MLADEKEIIKQTLKSLYDDLIQAETGPDRNTFGFTHILEVIYENLVELEPKIISEYPEMGELNVLESFNSIHYSKGDSGTAQFLKSRIKNHAIRLEVDLTEKNQKFSIEKTPKPKYDSKEAEKQNDFKKMDIVSQGLKILTLLRDEYGGKYEDILDEDIVSMMLGCDIDDIKQPLQYLEDNGYVFPTSGPNRIFGLRITPKGIEKLENLDDTNIQSYRILKNLEQQIRDFIESELSENNQKWWKQLIPGDVKDNAEQRKKDDEERKTWQFKEQPLISYIDFTDYEKIITRNDNWEEIFQYVFHDKISISAKLKEIEPIRNTISHSRNLDPYEEKQIRFYSEEILRSISYYIDNKSKIISEKTKIVEPTSPIPISVSFDRTVYPVNSKVHLRANIPEPIPNKPIIFQIFDNNDKLLFVKEISSKEFQDTQIAPDAGIYETSFQMDEHWKVGEKYRVKGIHGNSNYWSETRIDERKPVIQSDKSVYLWGSDMILTVIDPDADKDNQVPEFVGDRLDSKLVIESSKSKLENFRLRETGDSTGIFQGIIGFIGVEKNGNVIGYESDGKTITKTQGHELDDGFLEVSEFDELTITYTNCAGSANLTVLVVKDFESISKYSK